MEKPTNMDTTTTTNKESDKETPIYGTPISQTPLARPSAPKKRKSDFSSEIDNKKQKLNGMTDRQLLLHLIDKFNVLEDRFDYFEEEIEKVEKRIDDQEIAMNAQSKLIEKQQQQIYELEKMMEDNYCKAAEDNVVIKGIDCINNDASYRSIVKIFTNLGRKAPPTINSIRTLGKRKCVVKLTNPNDKTLLYKNSVTLRKNGIMIDDDLPPKLRQDKNTLLRRRRELLDNGVATTVKVYSRSLLVDGTDWYDYDRTKQIMEKRKATPNFKHI
jgi:hypothetical protein